jgi:hypothetical protein
VRTTLHPLSLNIVLTQLRKKRLPEVSLEHALELQQEDSTRKEIATRGNTSLGSIDRMPGVPAGAEAAGYDELVHRLHG